MGKRSFGQSQIWLKICQDTPRSRIDEIWSAIRLIWLIVNLSLYRPVEWSIFYKRWPAQCAQSQRASTSHNYNIRILIDAKRRVYCIITLELPILEAKDSSQLHLTHRKVYLRRIRNIDCIISLKRKLVLLSKTSISVIGPA